VVLRIGAQVAARKFSLFCRFLHTFCIIGHYKNHLLLRELPLAVAPGLIISESRMAKEQSIRERQAGGFLAPSAPRICWQRSEKFVAILTFVHTILTQRA
jgi:hypothetical protein